MPFSFLKESEIVPQTIFLSRYKKEDYKDQKIINSPMCQKSIVRFSFVFALIFTLTFSLKIKSAPISIPTTPFEALQAPFFDPVANRASWNSIVFKMKNNLALRNWEKRHVVDFFKKLTPIILEESLQTGVPPAALLAMAALESGYNTGYVSHITGNILSLNALENEAMLPPLKLHIHPGTRQVVLDRQKLTRLMNSGISLELKFRPSALKKDYRPIEIAGTPEHLDYFLNHEHQLMDAWKQNIHDFLSGRIHPDNTSPAYRSAYGYTQEIKQHKNLDFLLSEEAAVRFLSLVGGKPHSFNSNPSWVEKTTNLVKNMGLETFVQEYFRAFKQRYDLTEWQVESQE